MDDLDFASDDLAATEDFLVRAYGPMRIGGVGEHSPARIERRWLGDVNVDDLSFGFEMSYDVNPLGRVCVCRVRSGQLAHDAEGQPSAYSAAGDVSLLSLPDRPYTGSLSDVSFDVTMFDPALLDRVASGAPARRSRPVELLSQRPVSEAAGRRLGEVVEYVRDHVLAVPEARESPMVVSAAARYLAVSTLTALPNTALTDPTVQDRRDSTSLLLRRAKTFIDEHADEDIALSDIARAAYVTPRALQYMFRGHLDTTPMRYLRQVRLALARHDLVTADPAQTTVAAIATRWGFSHAGRFALRYRMAFGESPYTTIKFGS